VKILVDGVEVRETGDAAPALAYREVIAELIARGRTVVSVTLDGRVLGREEQTRVLDGEGQAGGALELTTVGTTELARATLEEVLKHLDVLRSGLHTVGDHLARTERTRALETFRPTLEIWMAVCEAVEKVCVIARIDTETGDDALSLEPPRRRIVDALGEIRSAFEQEDWVKLADLIEYEMLPAADAWETLVAALLSRLQTDAA